MMARMKRCILLLVSLALVFAPARLPSHAEELRYAVAPDTNVWFYASESETDKLFLIPETYYVRVLSKGEVYSAVEYLVNDPPYKKLVGYCRTEALTFVDFIPARPYLKRCITVAYTLPGGGELGGGLSSIEKTFVYYGMRYQTGQLYFYVLSEEGTFGYIPAAEPLTFELNDDWLHAPSPPVSGEPEEPEEPSDVLEIVLIVIVLAGAVGLAVLVLHARKAPPRGEE